MWLTNSRKMVRDSRRRCRGRGELANAGYLGGLPESEKKVISRLSMSVLDTTKRRTRWAAATVCVCVCVCVCSCIMASYSLMVKICAMLMAFLCIFSAFVPPTMCGAPCSYVFAFTDDRKCNMVL